MNLVMRKVKPVLLCGTLLLVTSVSISSPAAAADGPQLAAVSAGSTAIVWQPVSAYNRMVLTVSGPAGVFSREFDAATLPSLDLFGTDGQSLADGSYAWELRAVPTLSREARRELARVRRGGDSSRLDALRASGALPAEPLVQSGFFSVLDGTFVRSDLEEADAAGAPHSASAAVTSIHAADQVIPDDLIVQGSICTGFDCVNNESFGFDTIRLKENNLRIKFEDTSTTAGFPTVDWQLTANDSSSGGVDRFSIEDITAGRVPFTIRAGAPNNSLFVDSAGRLGIGTATPVVSVHAVSGNTPTLRLDQNGSSGFTPQVWDVAGNEVNFFVRDATNGSTLPFRIQPGAASSSLFIASGNRVGLGTSAPGQALHLRRTDGTAGFRVEEASATTGARTLMDLTNNGQLGFQLARTDGTSGTWTFTHNGNQFNISKVGTGANELAIFDNGNVQARGTITGNIANPSSRALKTGFAAIDPQDVLARLMSVPVVQWRYLDPDQEALHLGPMAEDFSAAFGVGDPDKIYLVDANGVAMAAIQGLYRVVEAKDAEIDGLRQALDALHGENAGLAARLTALEQAARRQ